MRSNDRVTSRTLLKCIVENSTVSEIIKMFYDSPLIRTDELFSKVGKDKKNVESLNFLIFNGFLTARAKKRTDACSKL
jgi:hypothetical protein